MPLSRARPILGFLSLLLPISLIFFLLKLPSKNPDLPQLIPVITIISAFNIIIMSGWLLFETIGGAVLTLVSLAGALWFGLRTGPGSLPFMASFLISSLLGYRLKSILNKADSAAVLRAERLSEEVNVLLNGILESRAKISSLEEKLKRYSALREAAESFSNILSLEGVTALIAEKALAIPGKGGRSLLFLVDAEKQELTLSASRDEAKVKTKKGDAFDRWVLRNRRSLIVEDAEKDFRFSADAVREAKDTFESLIAVPLVREHKVVGVLRVDKLGEPGYTQDDLRVINIIAALGAAAVQNALLYSRTQELSRKDSLTGLVVRRYFMERFQEEIKRAFLSNGRLSLLIMDIDHFKDYNDRFGHLAGDIILKHLAGAIKAAVGEGDIVVRYGGEEIAVLLCGKNKDEAAAQAENILKSVRESFILIRRKRTDVTMSIGLSGYPEDALSESELIRVADERLYKAKLNGRNRVCWS